jgi:hypothetical protein
VARPCREREAALRHVFVSVQPASARAFAAARSAAAATLRKPGRRAPPQHKHVVALPSTLFSCDTHEATTVGDATRDVLPPPPPLASPRACADRLTADAASAASVRSISSRAVDGDQMGSAHGGCLNQSRNVSLHGVPASPVGNEVRYRSRAAVPGYPP